MLFEESMKWRVLCKFFEEPKEEHYVKELARVMKISPGSASYSCKVLEKGGILGKEKKGNALYYSINNEDPFVKRLKSAWFLSKIMKFKESWRNEEFQSVALYGSHASGEFVSKSDVDILVLTSVKRKSVEEAFGKLRETLKRELSLTVLPVSKWHRMAEKKDRFYIEVLAHHILLYGAPLVMG